MIIPNDDIFPGYSYANFPNARSGHLNPASDYRDPSLLHLPVSSLYMRQIVGSNIVAGCDSTNITGEMWYRYRNTYAACNLGGGNDWVRILTLGQGGVTPTQLSHVVGGFNHNAALNTYNVPRPGHFLAAGIYGPSSVPSSAAQTLRYIPQSFDTAAFSYNTTSGKLTCRLTGIYVIQAGAGFDTAQNWTPGASNYGGSYVWAHLWRNLGGSGTVKYGIGMQSVPRGFASWVQVSGGVVLHLNANDTIELTLGHADSNPKNTYAVGSASGFDVYYLSAVWVGGG